MIRNGCLCDERMNVRPLETEGAGAARCLERGDRLSPTCRVGSHAGQEREQARESAAQAGQAQQDKKPEKTADQGA